ncbi:dTDP-4-dehydrorhamnose reductase [Brevundimonas alba]|uniref:dTDP-4-dehydrorhamnose reductase n=1 Tax=Brevundimonas alba TaxID=74314 RepID=A0A7X5YH34_9CAUL|nr:family 1 glycosylhydrolase [Brevundimonas alba]NJC39855.1 dTDP-4-dehydrorhamnose reductase [Brevundimonas alba]
MIAPELWGGHECTVNRVEDRWRDQSHLSGHHDRIEDLDRFAELGLKALRYPVLWERTELQPERFDWSWPDERLARMQALGLRPIVGLTHHGSGPAWTDLLDPAFPVGLARYAREVARRYPWVRDWTPVNEPLTTARFSALYGLWYPHRRDEGQFWLALLNQIDAVRLSMRAIREVNPEARLIQTEDFGHTWGTEPCATQANFENARRLMTWDLLTGRVVPGHPVWLRMEAYGLGARLDAIAEDPCPPDVLGLNHYVTSDRFLDHRLEHYPPQFHGGNGEIAYADVEAVRVLADHPSGWGRSIAALWNRYRLPIAVTECHLGCTPDQQRRWLANCWHAAVQARCDGVDLEAVTVWALLGSHDWDSLLTQWRGSYEPGAFDVSTGEPRLTPLGELVKELAADGAVHCDEPGWWELDQRLLYPPAHGGALVSGNRH